MKKKRLSCHLEQHIDFSRLPYNFSVLESDGKRIEKKKTKRHINIVRHNSSEVAVISFYKPVSSLL